MIWYAAYGDDLVATHAASGLGAVPVYFEVSPDGSGSGAGRWFLDLDVPAETVARAYLLTDDQFARLEEAEGPWYDLVVDLGEIDGVPVRTFTGFSGPPPSRRAAMPPVSRDQAPARPRRTGRRRGPR